MSAVAPQEMSPGRQPHQRPGAGYSFTVEFEGVPVQGVVEISGLKMEVEVIEVRQQNAEGTTTIRKLPGQRKGGELVLTRQLTGDSTFRDWMVVAQGVGGPTGSAQRDGTVVVFVGDGSPLQSHTVLNAWPRSLEVSSLRSGDSEVPTEAITLVYERLDPL